MIVFSQRINLFFSIVIFLLAIPGTATAEKDDSIAEAANAQVAGAMETIKTLAAIDSGSNHAPGLAAVAVILEDRLRTLDFKTQRHTSPTDVGADTITAIKKGTGTQKIMLMAHMDTVFEPGILTTMPIRTEEGKLFGPGVVDAKGGIAIVLHTLEILADRGWADYHSLTVLFNPDEETGSTGSGPIISKMAGEADTVLSFEVGGSNARGMAWVLAGTAAYARITLEVRGIPSHAGSDPEKGRNAIVELSHQILATKDVAKDIAGAQLNWTNVVSNKAFNQIPDLAIATGDARITVDGAEDVLLQALRSKIAEGKLIADTEASVSLEILRPGFRANKESLAVAQLAQSIYGEVDRRNYYIVPMVKGATDAGYAAVTDKVVVLEGFGPSGAGYHSNAEYLDTESLMPSMYQVARLLMELGTRSTE